MPSARVAIYVLLRHGTVVVQEAFKWPHTVLQLRLQVAAVCVKSSLLGGSSKRTVYSLVTIIGLKGHDHKQLSLPLYRRQHWHDCGTAAQGGQPFELKHYERYSSHRSQERIEPLTLCSIFS